MTSSSTPSDADALIDDPLGIEFVSTARRSAATVYIGETRNPRLAREMLLGLCNIVHPHGPVDELETFQQYYRDPPVRGRAGRTRSRRWRCGPAPGEAGGVLDGRRVCPRVQDPPDAGECPCCVNR
ncbi:hypothetical protein ACWEKR_29050 [Nocardia sp. NPDC004573]